MAGGKKHSKDKLKTNYSLEWNVTEFSLLGIKFSVDLNNISKLNFSRLTSKIAEIRNHWKKRSLTPLGKVTVLKTLILSNFIHLFTSLPTPSDTCLKNLNTIFFSFLWDKKTEKISRKTVKSDYKYGGIRMVDINNFIISLKLSWLQTLCKDVSPPWKIFETETINFRGILILGPHWSKIMSKSVHNPFLPHSP